MVFLGDRPSAAAWAGILIVPPALWLVSRSRPDDQGRVRAALGNGLAGGGIGIQYLALAQADGSGIWPVAAGRAAAVLAIAPMMWSPGGGPRPRGSGSGRR